MLEDNGAEYLRNERFDRDTFFACFRGKLNEKVSDIDVFVIGYSKKK